MKITYAAVLGAILIIAVASCSKKEQITTFKSSEANAPKAVSLQVGDNKTSVQHEDMDPPFHIQLENDYSPGKSHATIRVEIVPTINFDEMEIVWSLPDGVFLVEGVESTFLSASRLNKGDKNSIESRLEVKGKVTKPARITIKAKINGREFGTVKPVWLGPQTKAVTSDFRVVSGPDGSSYREIQATPKK